MPNTPRLGPEGLGEGVVCGSAALGGSENARSSRRGSNSTRAVSTEICCPDPPSGQKDPMPTPTHGNSGWGSSRFWRPPWAWRGLPETESRPDFLSTCLLPFSATSAHPRILPGPLLPLVSVSETPPWKTALRRPCCVRSGQEGSGWKGPLSPLGEQIRGRDRLACWTITPSPSIQGDKSQKHNLGLKTEKLQNVSIGWDVFTFFW